MLPTGKRRNKGSRVDMNAMSAVRSPRKSRIRWKTVSWRIPFITPYTAIQIPMVAGSKPSPPNSTGVVYTKGSRTQLAISRKENQPWAEIVRSTGLVRRERDDECSG